MKMKRPRVLAFRLSTLAFAVASALVPSTGQAIELPTHPDELVPRWSAFSGGSLTVTPAGNVINTGHTGAQAMAVSPDGSRTYVTGPSGTIAYDAASGTQLWSISASGGQSLAVSPDGARVYVSRRTNHQFGVYDTFTTTAHDALTGAQLWVARYESPEGGIDGTGWAPQFLAVSPDGTRVYVTGWSGKRNATVAYDATDGGQLWATRSMEVSSSTSGFVNGLAVSPDGTRVYVSGGRTVAYDAVAGSQLWSAGGGGSWGGFAMSPNGSSVYVVGFESGTAWPYARTVITSSYATADGSLRWLARYTATQYTQMYEAAISVSPDDRQVYVTVPMAELGHGVSATLAYKSVDGSLGWFARYHDSRDGHNPYAGYFPSLFFPTVSVSPDEWSFACDCYTGSRVYVTGTGYNGAETGGVAPSAVVSTRYSIILVYDPRNGTEMSVTSFEGAVSDVAISPDGSRLFATGSIYEEGVVDPYGPEPTGYRFHGYATVAYCTAPAGKAVDYLLSLPNLGDLQGGCLAGA